MFRIMDILYFEWPDLSLVFTTIYMIFFFKNKSILLSFDCPPKKYTLISPIHRTNSVHLYDVPFSIYQPL